MTGAREESRIYLWGLTERERIGKERQNVFWGSSVLYRIPHTAFWFDRKWGLWGWLLLESVVLLREEVLSKYSMRLSRDSGSRCGTRYKGRDWKDQEPVRIKSATHSYSLETKPRSEWERAEYLWLNPGDGKRNLQRNFWKKIRARSREGW